MRDGVEIELRGKTGSGKTAILHVIGDTGVSKYS
jgi:ABC-type lipoprotein export system ATPase subunit